MYHRIKNKIKTSRAVQYTLLLLLIVIIAFIPYPIPHNLKQETVSNVESVKSCLVSMGLPPTLPDCASKLSIKEVDAKDDANEVWKYSRFEKERGWASIVSGNFSDAVLHLENTSEFELNHKQMKKDIAFSYMSLRQYAGAVQPCIDVLARDANDTFCLDVLGIVYYVTDKNNDAFESGKKAYGLEPAPCRYLNMGLYYGNTGNISEAKRIIDDVIKTSKSIVLACWSPIKSNIPAGQMDRYNLCFLNNDKSKSICRAFAREGWVEGNVTQKKTAEDIKKEEEQKKLLAEMEAGRVL